MAALGPFSIDTYLPSFHDIGQSLKATAIEVQQTLSVYLLAFAVMTLWHGALSDRFGRRRVILVALALFGAASAGCAFATSIAQLWLWRGLQGMTAGAGMVVTRAIVRDLFDGPPAALDSCPDTRVTQFVHGEAGERLSELERGE